MLLASGVNSFHLKEFSFLDVDRISFHSEEMHLLFILDEKNSFKGTNITLLLLFVLSYFKSG